LPKAQEFNCGSLKRGELDPVRGSDEIARESYPRAYRSGLRAKAPPASAVAIASSNFVSVVDVYQIHPDLSITKSYFRNGALAVMRFERAERCDQNA
jgi:hypothetical protein